MVATLEFSDEPLLDLLSGTLHGKRAGILTDPHFQRTVSHLPHIPMGGGVNHQEISRITQMVQANGWNLVVGLGGCRTLDMARLVAPPSGELVLVPTILSTPCISSDAAVIYTDHFTQVAKTAPPARVIVPLHWMQNDDQEVQRYYFAAGAGDLMANISSSIQGFWESYSISGHTPVISPSAYPVLEFLNSVRSLDRATLTQFAQALHDHATKDHQRPRVAGEHALYYHIFFQQRYPHHKPTHGAIVSIGTLLSAWLIGKITQDFALFKRIKSVHMNLGLPTTVHELEAIGIQKAHILQGIASLKSEGSNTILCQVDSSVLDEVYG